MVLEPSSPATYITVPPESKRNCLHNVHIRPTLLSNAPLLHGICTHSETQTSLSRSRRAAQFVMGDFKRLSSVTAMLNYLKWPSLQERRFQNRLLMMHKIRYYLVYIHWQAYLTATLTATRRHNSQFTSPQTSSTV